MIKKVFLIYTQEVSEGRQCDSCGALCYGIGHTLEDSSEYNRGTHIRCKKCVLSYLHGNLENTTK